MTVADICKRVRWCLDEEALNVSGLVSAYDFALVENEDGTTTATSTDYGLMNNIIKDKIGDALRWICLYAPAEQLSGGGGSSGSDGQKGTSIQIVVDDEGNLSEGNRIPLGKNFIRLIRVRCEGWHRAVMGDSLLREDSDEYLQLMDEYGANATVDRPHAALIEKAEKQVEVWPHQNDDKYELTKLVMPSSTDLGSMDDTSDVGIPTLLEASFIYYLAFLTLSAYADARAARMLEIAKMSLGQTEDRQRS